MNITRARVITLYVVDLLIVVVVAVLVVVVLRSRLLLCQLWLYVIVLKLLQFSRNNYIDRQL